MANKRMFSKQITTSDAFVEMPVSSQLLYFHLNMEADDDGFVANPKRLMRMLNVGDDDFKILLAKRFILAFDNGVIVIKHWLLHNAVRKDMYKPTQYLEQKETLTIKDNGVYTDRNDSVTKPLHRLDKVRLDKIESSMSFLKEIPEEKLEEMYQKFDCDKKAIKSKAEDLYNYCQAKGKVYKNYHALLLNALKKDFKERKEPLQTRKIIMVDGKPTIIE